MINTNKAKLAWFSDPALNNMYSILLTKPNDTKLLSSPVCIFKVPESVIESNPEAYIPQLLGLGPYNHFRSELQQMQTFKLAMVSEIRRRLASNALEFDMLVRVLKGIGGLASSVRASCATNFEMDDESLVCLVVVDGLYLFELLRRCVVAGYDDCAGRGFFRDFVGFARGNQYSRAITVQDAIKLENQIPIHAIRLILTAEYGESILAGEKRSLAVVTELFPKILLGFASALSPLKVLKDYPLYKVSSHSHLLDLLYSLVTLGTPPEKDHEEEEKDTRRVMRVAEAVRGEISQAFGVINPSFKAASLGAVSPQESDESPVAEEVIEAIGHLVVDVLLSPEPAEIIQGLFSLPWPKIWSYVKRVLTGNIVTEDERLVVPGARLLGKQGITFRPVDRIVDIKFDKDTRTVHVPRIRLDGNSEVVLRNLVAYEAMVKGEVESLVLARYVTLMSGLAKSGTDVQFLVNKAIIEGSSFVGDGEVVAELFRGASEGVSAGAARTNAEGLERAIDEVNGYYNGLWSVCMLKFMRKWGWICLNCCVVFVFLLVCLGLTVLSFWLVYKSLFKGKN